jgi:hypothetical protein
MKIKTGLLTALFALTVLFSLSLGTWGNVSGSTNGENGPVPSMTPAGDSNPGPKYKTVKLSCSTGVIYTMVKNNTGKPIPADAKITVQGVQADCAQTAKGPLAKGQSIKLLGCQPNVTTCTAFAKWALED